MAGVIGGTALRPPTTSGQVTPFLAAHVRERCAARSSSLVLRLLPGAGKKAQALADARIGHSTAQRSPIVAAL